MFYLRLSNPTMNGLYLIRFGGSVIPIRTNKHYHTVSLYTKYIVGLAMEKLVLAMGPPEERWGHNRPIFKMIR